MIPGGGRASMRRYHISPPRARLDLLNLGCNHLLNELWRIHPSLYIFGHVHKGYGQKWLTTMNFKGHFSGCHRSWRVDEFVEGNERGAAIVVDTDESAQDAAH
jgi:hypothetical protein